jgi:hypothetical protein
VVDDLKLKMKKLTMYMDRSILDQASASMGLISTVPPQSEQATARPSAGFMVARPSGHRVEHATRVDGIGDSSSQFHCPANGMNTIPNPVSPPIQDVVHDDPLVDADTANTHQHTGRLPKFDFPLFEGDNPKLWIV